MSRCYDVKTLSLNDFIDIFKSLILYFATEDEIQNTINRLITKLGNDSLSNIYIKLYDLYNNDDASSQGTGAQAQLVLNLLKVREFIIFHDLIHNDYFYRFIDYRFME